MPSAKDILRSYTIRNSSDDQLGLSIDIKSAHKHIAIRPSERGLVGFSWQNRLHFYRVCPFGATFSAHWWSRLQVVSCYDFAIEGFTSVILVSYMLLILFSRNQIRYCQSQRVSSCYCFKPSNYLYPGVNVSFHIP